MLDVPEYVVPELDDLEEPELLESDILFSPRGWTFRILVVLRVMTIKGVTGECPSCWNALNDNTVHHVQ